MPCATLPLTNQNTSTASASRAHNHQNDCTPYRMAPLMERAEPIVYQKSKTRQTPAHPLLGWTTLCLAECGETCAKPDLPCIHFSKRNSHHSNTDTTHTQGSFGIFPINMATQNANALDEPCTSLFLFFGSTDALT